MKLFIDSADLSEIKEIASMGILDGCTTNPSLLAKVGRKIETAIPEICEIVDGPVSAEVVSVNYEEILTEGRALAKLHKNVVVKVPLISEGLKAVKTFTKEGIKTNVTLCFSATQALLAAKAGATFISPFLGRIDDTSHEGMELIEQIVTIYQNYDLPTQVLAASIRSPYHVTQAAMVGAHCATIPGSILKQLIKHPLTDIGLEKFLADAKKSAATAK
ncbi:fructose-6-phosphate aldolase [Pendulispora brunnea]|uniref:Probable transaldolase n=1 Tax=Pendulispora brunnea TaxID=2905690 RepID=A0ABZ2K363_9BACT